MITNTPTETTDEPKTTTEPGSDARAPLPYDTEWFKENWEKVQPFFQCGGVLLLTQDGHWVYGHSFSIAPALIKAGSNPSTQCKIFLVVGDPEPRVNERGQIIVRQPAQVYQAAQVELAALLPPCFMHSQIVTSEKKLIIPG